jgi:hypothetical protein
MGSSVAMDGPIRKSGSPPSLAGRAPLMPIAYAVGPAGGRSASAGKAPGQEDRFCSLVVLGSSCEVRVPAHPFQAKGRRASG